MRETLDVASRFSFWMYECNLEHVFILKGQSIHDIIMRRKAVQIMIKMIQRRLDAILHWNISFVGGFLGGYAILSNAGVFGSAQTGNLMEMASNVRFMEWEELGLRLLAMVIFACGVIASYMLTNYTNLHMRKLAIWVDAAGLGLTALLPDWFSPIAGVYPIFFCSAFQWGVYSGADGFNSATVFITNNFKQSVLGWTQYALTKDKEFKRKAVLYSNTVLMFFLGALLGVTGVAAFGNALGACVGFIPLAVARIFISIGELPVEDETPEETEEEAEEMMEEAKILEKEEKKKI